MTTVLTFGCWDLLHVGHVNFLQRAAQRGDHLVVGVPTDRVIEDDKGAPPIIPFQSRCAMLEALGCVYHTVGYQFLEFLRPLYQVQPNFLAVGEEWGSHSRHEAAEKWCADNHVTVFRLGRDVDESTTSIKERIVEEHKRHNRQPSASGYAGVIGPSIPPTTLV